MLGTLECICAAENMMMLPGGPTRRISGRGSSASVAFGSGRVSAFVSFATSAELFLTGSAQ
jgi:hypothetical protein